MSPTARDLVQVILEMKNVRKFVADAEKSAGAVAKVGTESEKAGKKGRLGAKGLAVAWAGGAAAIYGATRFVKGAVSATEDLGRSTLAVQRTTGMDIKTSSEWATVIKSRGIETKKFQMGMVSLSKEIQKTQKGTKHHDSALEQLGITTENVAVQTGNTQEVLLQAADALSKLEDPTKRAALAQKLFSRAGIALAPVLFKGSAAVREQLGLADEYGATLSGKSAKAVMEEIAHQRELKIAYQGVQVQLGSAMLPILLSVTTLVVKLTKAVQPLTHNATLLKIVLIGLAAALVLYKIALITATIATAVFETTAAPIVGIVLGIVVALALLGVAAYMVVKHWDAIRAAAFRTWTWIKQNWPMIVLVLVAPFAAAAILIVKHFDVIKHAAVVVVNTIIRVFRRLLGFFRGLHFPHVNVPGAGLLGRARGALPFQHGGTMPYSGTALVGERGPELVSLPRASTVTPLQSSEGSLSGAGVFDTAHVTTQLVLDRRVLAEAVGRYTADQMARR